MAPTWNQSAKLFWTLTAAWYRQNYINSPILGPTGAEVVGTEIQPPRRDNLSSQQIGLTYIPYRWLLFNFLYRHDRRSSNASFPFVNGNITVPLAYGYDDNVAQAGVKLRF